MDEQSKPPLEQRENVDGIGRAGKLLLIAAAVVFVLGFAGTVVIQGNLPCFCCEFIGLIAYFCGPLPIVPGIFAMPGIIALAVSSIRSKKSLSHRRSQRIRRRSGL